MNAPARPGGVAQAWGLHPDEQATARLHPVESGELGRESMRWLSRIGFATKGFVYWLMGSLALLTALGQRGGQIGDKRRSVQILQAIPGGRVLLGLIAMGLTAYAFLRIAQGLFDTEHKGHAARGVVRRFGYIVNGVIYIGLIGYAAHGALTGQAGTSGRDAERSWSVAILAWRAGPWILVFIGAVTVGAGLYTFYQAATSKFLEAIELETLGRKRRALIRSVGMLGYTARGIVMIIVGAFFVHAGKTARAEDVGSSEDALGILAKMSPVVLATVALGLATYGVYAFLQSLYPVRPRS